MALRFGGVADGFSGNVYAFVLPGSSTCAARWEDALGDPNGEYITITPRQYAPGGPFSLSGVSKPRTRRGHTTGSYKVCAYFASNDESRPQIAARRTFAVSAPRGTVAIERTRIERKGDVATVRVSARVRSDRAAYLVMARLGTRSCTTDPRQWPGILAPLAPWHPVGAAMSQAGFSRDTVAIPAGSSLVGFQGTIRFPRGVYGTRRYAICSWLGATPLECGWPRLDVARATRVVSVTRPWPKPAMLAMGVTRYIDRRSRKVVSVATDLSFRGCRNDTHTFRSIRVSVPTRRFDQGPRFTGGSSGRVSGRFSAGWRSATGHLRMRKCSFAWTWRHRR